MDNEIRSALESIRLDWAETPDDVWGATDPFHVSGLHEQTITEIIHAFDDARRSSAASPLGVAVRGPAGSGKTHLLGQVRERVQASGGYFFLVKLLDGTDFWRSVLVAILEDLSRPTPTHRSQLTQLIDRLAREAGVSEDTRESVTGASDLSPDSLDAFVRGVYTKHSRHRRRSQHILRALVLTESDDYAAKDLGEAFLHLDADATDELATWGIRAAKLGYQEIVENISRIIAFDDAAVIAIDQIDTLIEAARAVPDPGEESQIEQVAHGLMTLRDTMSRTASVVSSITAAWEYLESRVLRSAVERFRQPPTLQRPSSADFGTQLISRRFAPCFARIDFVPPYPTWPVTESALKDSIDYTPRELMMAIDRQIGSRLRRDEFSEITELAATAPPQAAPASPTEPSKSASAHSESGVSTPHLPDTQTNSPELAAIEHRYAELLTMVDPGPALAHETEDLIVPPLLQAGLTAWIEALPSDIAQQWKLDPKPSAKAVLHGKIRQIIDPHRDVERSWSFRALASPNARAVQSRLSNATTSAGLSLGTVSRTLIVLRRGPWPSGPKTTQAVDELQSRGGQVIAWSLDDIRQLMALAQLRSEQHPQLHEWIAERNPAAEIDFLAEVLGAAAATTPATTPRKPGPAPQSPISAAPPAPTARPVASTPAPSPVRTAPEVATTPAPTDVLPLGHRSLGGEPVSVPLLALRKHTAIFAGSGSGKTVLIRRIIEEAALQGVSSIVLDINNDLARLGMPWPAEHQRIWNDGDRALAARYFAETEVAVFTPGRSAGRPLSFRPLPDFSLLEVDSDEFAAAVDSAVGALAPQARATGTSMRAPRYEAVLRQTMTAFGRRGGGDLRAFVAMLSELPDGVSDLADAQKLATDLAENLKAAIANDPLLSGDAAHADPGYLLTPSPGFRARVSVINLAGLGSGDRVAGYVNQLQMALFAWVKKHPATDRPLGGLFIMDEAQNFAPSQGRTTALQSTLALASQARKYGLGLVFATQSPTGIHNRISGNAATQFFGLLNHPTQISVAKELAARKGSPIPDVGKLPTGTFYTAVDGGRFVKVDTPLCLSYHPQSPPTEDEVIEIARNSTR